MMKFQPNRNYKSNDVVYTPLDLAGKIVKHFNPTGRKLEPCAGGGAFLEFMKDADWCEIANGRDFLKHDGHYDWIVTNPPWSKIREFLAKSFSLADNVVFLMTVNHVFTKARIRLMKEHNFGLKEILLLDTPMQFPQSGFQLAAILYSKGFTGDCRIAFLNESEIR